MGFAALAPFAPFLGAGLNAGFNWLASQQQISSNEGIAARNEALAREFAQNGIRWRVADAKAAGIHPLAALGASVGSSPTVSVGDDPRSDFLRSTGQDISRALMATRGRSERETAMQDLELENARLKNDFLKVQIHNASQVGPSFPNPMDSSLIPGQGNAPGVEVTPARVTASRAGVPGQEAGAINDFAYARSPTGLYIVPSADSAGRTQQGFLPQIEWYWRNKLSPFLSGGSTLTKPDLRTYPLPKGYDWAWVPWANEFRPLPVSKAAAYDRLSRQNSSAFSLPRFQPLFSN